MKFEEAVYEFRNRLIEEYGVSDPIVKMGLDYEMYNIFIRELDKYRSSSFISLSEPEMFGIKFVPRKKDDF